MPTSHLTIDKLMISFYGQTKHNIKIYGKPIKEGFKIQCLSFKGYIQTFYFHLGQEDDEGIAPSRVVTQPMALITYSSSSDVSSSSISM